MSVRPLAEPDVLPWVAATSGRPVLLGARLGITLAPVGEAVRIGSAPQPIQPVVDRADVAAGRWDVRADEPGEHRLRATVSVYRTDSDDLLLPAEDVEVVLRVRRTAGSLSREVLGVAGGTVTWLLGVLTALSGAGVVALAIDWWRKRRQPASGRAEPATPPAGLRHAGLEGVG